MKKYATHNQRAVRKDTWQVIYMDLMTIIMVFFVILWSINQGKDVGVSETVGDVTARMINLPGDVLFAPGKTNLRQEGRDIFRQLFNDESGAVLNFQTSGLVKRMLMIHGHTDGTGSKEKNLGLGYQRAHAAYREIRKYSKELPDHVIICTHADNTPAQEVPDFAGNISKVQRSALREARARNRRITIEDRLVNAFEADE